MKAIIRSNRSHGLWVILFLAGLVRAADPQPVVSQGTVANEIKNVTPAAPAPQLPQIPPLPAPRLIRPRPIATVNPTAIPLNTVPNLPTTQSVQPTATPVPVPAVAQNPNALTFDAKEKFYEAKPGENQAKFTFAVTNTSTELVVINEVKTSCGCTAAKLPSQPWRLAPNEGGEIGFTMDLTGKFGSIAKSATVITDHGQQLLVLRVNIPMVNNNTGANGTQMDRSRNLQIAAADRQAVFRNDCATCHFTPTIGKTGKPLYDAACGICHDGEHRASFVPNLRALNKPTDTAYWTQWILHGREGSLMPAFEKSKGGPLDEEQVKSLALYLESDFKVENMALPKPATPAPVTPAPIRSGTSPLARPPGN